MRLFTSAARGFWGAVKEPRASRKTPLEKAVLWVKTHRVPGCGIPVHHKHRVPTQEVTGYLIPTLCKLGENGLAKELARWEASVQRADGGFSAVDTTPYTFDTAQVVRGFLAVLDEMPELELNLRRACDFVETHISEKGEVTSPSYEMWKVPGGGTFSSYANLYVLPPLLEAGRRLSELKYVAAAKRGMAYYRQMPDLVEFKPSFGTLSHIFGYMMEALVDLGEVELARKGLQQAAAIQKPNGAIPAYPGVAWICSTGVAQLALAWYKLGEIDPAERALGYLETVQNLSGGFYGSYGPGAAYFSDAEISWAVKFFLDCCLLRETIGEPQHEIIPRH